MVDTYKKWEHFANKLKEYDIAINAHYDRLEAQSIVIKDAIENSLIVFGYTKTEDLDNKLVHSAVRADNISHQEVVEMLTDEIDAKLDWIGAKEFNLTVMPDDQWISPAFGYYAQCYYQ